MNQNNNNNEVDTVVQEALKVYEAIKPIHVERILETYRKHIEQHGLNNTPFNYPWFIQETRPVKQWFDKQGYIIQLSERTVTVDPIEDRFNGYNVVISKRV